MASASTTSLPVLRTWYVLRYMVVGATYPMVAMWVEEAWGEKGKVGLMMGAIGLVQLSSQQLWGYLGDMVWSRRSILMVNMGVAMPLLLLSGLTTDWAVFLLVWVGVTFFMTPVNPFMDAIVMSSVRGRGRYGEIRAWGTIGFVLACLLVGYLARVCGTTWVCFPTGFAAGTAAWLWLWRIHAPHIPPKDRPPFHRVQHFFLARSHFVWFLLALLINRMADSPMVLFQVFLAKNLAPAGWGDLVGTALFVVAATAEVVALLHSDRLLARFGELRCLVWATGAGLIRFVLTPIVGLPGLFALQLLHALSFGLYFVAGVSWMDRHAPREFKTSAQTLYTMVFFGLAPLVGNPLFGWLWDRLGEEHLREIFWGGSLILALSLVALSGAIRSEPPRAPAETLPLPGETPAGQ